MTPIPLLPTERRPRERFAKFGVQGVSLEELVAIVVGTGTPLYPLRSISQQVSWLLVSGEISPERLTQVSGLGPVHAGRVLAALHLGVEVERARSQISHRSPEHIYAACIDLLDKPQEELVVFYLNVRGTSLARETVSLGTATASLVHPREVFRPAILHNATHIVLAHNHPSGDPSPSAADRDVTKRISRAGLEVGIELVDHVICASTGFHSLRSRDPELFL
jgi:DNA repair protein RadC